MLITEETCRVCLGKHRLSTILAKNIPEKIKYCASVEVSQDDELPKMICNQCLFYLDIAYIFRTVCEATDIRLHKYFRERKRVENSTESSINQDCSEVLYNSPSPVANEVVIGEEEKDLESEINLVPSEPIKITDDESKESIKIGRHTAKKISARIPKRLPPVVEANKCAESRELHEELESRDEPRIHHCAQCPKSFTYLSHLRRHMSVHSATRMYSCHHCPKKFINRYNLKVHLLKHTGRFRHHCVSCKRGFSSPSLLKRHLNSHDANAEFQCKYCPKKMLHSSSLKLHEKMHLYRPSYTCDICFKTFAYTSSLAQHRKNHEGRKDNVCTICDKTFTRRTSLKRHLASHKIRSEPNLASKKVHGFNCDQCDKKFLNRSLFVKHLKDHIGIKD